MKALILVKFFLISYNLLALEAVESKTNFDYKIIFGNILKLGQAKISYKRKRDLYHIKMKVTPTGIAGFLSDHKEEYFESIGKIKNDALFPEYYIRERKTETTNFKSIHQFDHINKKIKLTELEINESTKKPKMVKDSVLLKFYVINDVLSSFFNLGMKSQSEKLKTKNISFETLTLGEDKNKINVSVLNQKAGEKELKVELFEYDMKSKKLYDKKEFFLDMGQKSEFKKITIKNLFWLGNLEGILL